MHLVQLLLPLKDNAGKPFPANVFDATKQELVDRFGGLTTFTQSPAEGIWAPDADKYVRDPVIIFEVMTEHLERSWWKDYQKKLCARFTQDELVVRSSVIDML